MLGTFRKHSTWLWGIIIAAVAVSLVWWTGSPGGQGSDGRTENLGSIGGKKITQAEFVRAAKQARLEYFFQRAGQQQEEKWPSAEYSQQEAYRQLFFNHKIKELGIHVSDGEVQKIAAMNLKAFGGPNGNLTSDIFAEQVLARGGVDLADYERYLRGMIGRQQLAGAISVGGQLVSEKDARAIYERENQEISAQAVFFSASNYLANVTVTPEALSGFYSNYAARYRLPERVQVSYVEFKATNFWADAAADLAKITNLTEQIENVYQQRGGTNYYTEMTPEKAKESIRFENHNGLALRHARTAAAKFVTPLLEPGVKVAALAERAAKEGVNVKVTSAFDAQSGPAELNVNEAFVRAAFALRDDEPIAEPVVTRDAIYVLAKNSQLPSEVPPFEAIREKVTSDYRMLQAARSAQAAAQALIESANGTNGLAAGTAFTALCAKVGATPMMVPAFSASTRSLPEIEAHTSLQEFKQVVSQMPEKSVSGVRGLTGSGVVHVMRKLDLDDAKITRELPEFTRQLREARQEEAFRKWFESEAGKVLADTPVMQRQAQVGPSGN